MFCQYPLINYPGYEEKIISDSETTASSQDNFMPYIVNIEGNGSKFHDDLENNDENEDIDQNGDEENTQYVYYICKYFSSKKSYYNIWLQRIQNLQEIEIKPASFWGQCPNFMYSWLNNE